MRIDKTVKNNKRIIIIGGVLGAHESTSPLGYASILGETGEPTCLPPGNSASSATLLIGPGWSELVTYEGTK